MNKALNKLKSRSGFTLIEMIAATVILILLAAAMSTGLAVATKSYRESVFVSDSQVLSDTLDTAISDVLRYARFTENGDGDTVCFGNDDYNIPDSGYFVDENGRIYIDFGDGSSERKLLINSGAYTTLDVTGFYMTYDGNTNTFSGGYSVEGDGGVSKAFEFSYRSLKSKNQQDAG